MAGPAAPLALPGPLALLGAPLLPPLLLLLLLALSCPSDVAAEEEANYVELLIFQESFPEPGSKAAAEAGEYLQEFEGEAIFQVDWARRTVSWNLPDFTRFGSFEAAQGLGVLSVAKNNLEVYMKLSNRTRARNAAPSAKVYTKDPVELGDPNILVCFVDQFSPPVLNVTWLKNGKVVSEGVKETGFLPSADNAFSKFSYLTFVPEDGDFYTCRVEHWGLEGPLTTIWVGRSAGTFLGSFLNPPSPIESKGPPSLPETSENVLCGLGLAIGILGIIVGTILFFKAMRMTDRNISSRRSGGL
ncbi:RLA class II histocompatibility antigen, DP alpha-1 chain [Anolis carolinensis]|uniref:RLA class II histocompatibility antigen, DP alpha-1 chain n=1 Tax=Anolis carolinensis TaxID=28377 RepID=UPI002F2B2233